jgi:CheY-like chemotaxis protein
VRLTLDAELPGADGAPRVAIRVHDTGIGIPPERVADIFEPFVQVDSSLTRESMGTGLGLSISREITRLLGGELRVESSAGRGSVFTLYVPLNFSPATQPVQPARMLVAARPAMPTLETEAGEAIIDDRDAIAPGDSVVLIVEDDPRFASILLTLVRDAGFKGVATAEGSAAISLARRFSPDAIMLDIGLPDMDGLALLDLLKHTAETRHIPVHLISADDQRGLGLSMGAFGFTHKPVEREIVVSTLEGVKSYVGKSDRRLVLVGGDGEAAEALRQCFPGMKLAKDLARVLEPGKRPDGIVVQASALPSATLIGMLREAELASPVVVYAPEELDPEDERRLRLAVFGGLLRIARTPEHLIDQATLMLHAPVDTLPEPARARLAQPRQEDSVLNGRKVLVIDDDIRNIFSLASALEEYGVDLSYAESGRAGIELLRQQDADVVLVDIMMPDMDGYETMREVRAMKGFSDIPIVAVTAKAMKGDRQKCIQAGASDYVSKPVDIDQLISVLRVSIQRTDAARMATESVKKLLKTKG